MMKSVRARALGGEPRDDGPGWRIGRSAARGPVRIADDELEEDEIFDDEEEDEEFDDIEDEEFDDEFDDEDEEDDEEFEEDLDVDLDEDEP